MSNPDYTEVVPLPPAKRGDRWVGISQIGPVLINEATPTDNLVRIRMVLQLEGKTTTTRFVIDSDDVEDRDAPAEIEDAVNWVAKIPPVQDFVELAGNWKWDMAFYDAGNTKPLTLYKGVLIVNPDV